MELREWGPPLACSLVAGPRVGADPSSPSAGHRRRNAKGPLRWAGTRKTDACQPQENDAASLHVPCFGRRGGRKTQLPIQPSAPRPSRLLRQLGGQPWWAQSRLHPKARSGGSRRPKACDAPRGAYLAGISQSTLRGQEGELSRGAALGWACRGKARQDEVRYE